MWFLNTNTLPESSKTFKQIESLTIRRFSSLLNILGVHEHHENVVPNSIMGRNRWSRDLHKYRCGLKLSFLGLCLNAFTTPAYWVKIWRWLVFCWSDKQVCFASISLGFKVLKLYCKKKCCVSKNISRQSPKYVKIPFFLSPISVFGFFTYW